MENTLTAEDEQTKIFKRSTLTDVDLKEIDQANTCKNCGFMNSENCNTCDSLQRNGYSFETGI